MNGAGQSQDASSSVIEVDGVAKFFEIYRKPSHRLWQMMCRGRRRFYEPFWALRDVSFRVGRGECVGIIGRNGAGKSTLLQIITGTLTPSSGRVLIRGRVAALLELGSGFNPEFTGRENVYLNAAILGLAKEKIDARYEDIAAFADIGEFIEQPVKTYSSGMVVRLAFAVVVHVDADILIIDEALAVGDAFFTQKCMRFLRSFIAKRTALFVSHDISAVNSLCNKAILLESGRIKQMGSPKEVAETYLKDMYEAHQGSDASEDGPSGAVLAANPAFAPEDFRDMRADFINVSALRNDIRIFSFNEASAAFGKKGADITGAVLLDAENRPLNWIVGGEPVSLQITVAVREDIFSPIVGFFLKNRLGQHIFGDNTFLAYRDNPLFLRRGTTARAIFSFIMPILEVGDYSISAAVAEGTHTEHIQHDWRHDVLLLRSVTTSCATGMVGIPMKHISINVFDSE
jgi:lipopolysaccharide transport system ATP-binding protein